MTKNVSRLDDTGERVVEIVRKFWQREELFLPLAEELFDVSHREKKKEIKKALIRKWTKGADIEKHIRECPRCQKMVSAIIERLEGLLPHK